MLHHSALAERVIGLAIQVHRQLGPGLLESVQESCLSFELDHAGIAYQRQIAIPIVYRDITLETGYRADFVIANTLLIEIKSIEAISPVHEA